MAVDGSVIVGGVVLVVVLVGLGVGAYFLVRRLTSSKGGGSSPSPPAPSPAPPASAPSIKTVGDLPLASAAFPNLKSESLQATTVPLRNGSKGVVYHDGIFVVAAWVPDVAVTDLEGYYKALGKVGAVVPTKVWQGTISVQGAQALMAVFSDGSALATAATGNPQVVLLDMAFDPQLNEWNKGYCEARGITCTPDMLAPKTTTFAWGHHG